MTAQPTQRAPMPPRSFVRFAWAAHRAIYRITDGRRGLHRPTPDDWGTMRVSTIGRRTGAERAVILGYYEDGPTLVTMTMNGWADPEPAWWLNLQAQPDVIVETSGGSGRYHAHAANADERPRPWTRWAHHDEKLDAYAARRSRETQVVILEPQA